MGRERGEGQDSTMKTTISVIIPTIGRKSLLDCASSIVRQERKPEEIIIVDNSPGQKAREEVKRLSVRASILIRYLHEPIRGAAHARNAGIRGAKGDILFFIDDDCIADTHWLKEGEQKLKNLGLSVVLKGHNKNGLPGDVLAESEYVNDELFFRANYVTDGKHVYSPWLDSKNCAMPRKLLVGHSLFFKPYHIFEDLDLSLRLRKKNIPVVLCSKMALRHMGTRSLPEHWMRSIRKGIDRQRFNGRIGGRPSRLERLYFGSCKPITTADELREELQSADSPFRRLLVRMDERMGAICMSLGYLLGSLDRHKGHVNPI